VNFTYNGSSTAPTTAGSYAVIAAIYDTNYSGSVTGAMVILQATSAAGVTSNSNPVLLQNAATFTATVSSKVGTPTGTVTFLDGTTPLGTGTLSGGLATLTTSALTAGTHSISAAYGGDTNFAAASSGALTQTVLELQPDRRLWQRQHDANSVSWRYCDICTSHFAKWQHHLACACNFDHKRNAYRSDGNHYSVVVDSTYQYLMVVSGQYSADRYFAEHSIAIDDVQPQSKGNAQPQAAVRIPEHPSAAVCGQDAPYRQKTQPHAVDTAAVDRGHDRHGRTKRLRFCYRILRPGAEELYSDGDRNFRDIVALHHNDVDG
jgi:hypothetical protein